MKRKKSVFICYLDHDYPNVKFHFVVTIMTLFAPSLPFDFVINAYYYYSGQQKTITNAIIFQFPLQFVNLVINYILTHGFISFSIADKSGETLLHCRS